MMTECFIHRRGGSRIGTTGQMFNDWQFHFLVHCGLYNLRLHNYYSGDGVIV